jgi:hypothetical protein
MARERGKSVLHLDPPPLAKVNKVLQKPPPNQGLPTRSVRLRHAGRNALFRLRWPEAHDSRGEMLHDHVDGPPVVIVVVWQLAGDLGGHLSLTSLACGRLQSDGGLCVLLLLSLYLYCGL